MATVVLKHTAPVYVAVDTEEGRVTQVTVADEELTYPAGEATDENGKVITDAAQIALAEKIAGCHDWPGDGFWPRWEFGS